MGSKARKAAIARRRAKSRIKGDLRREGRKRGDRSAAKALALKSTTRYYAQKAIDRIGPGGGVKAVGRAAARSALGRKALTVARQKLSRIPGIGRAFGRTRAARQPLVYGSRVPAVRSARSLAIRSTVPIAIGAGAGGAAFEGGRRIFDAIPGGIDVARRIRGRVPSRRRGGTQGIPFTPGAVVPTDSITHTWIANGVPFAQLADGRVMVQRKNGTIKTFRRPRPIVLGRNPGIRDISRAYKKIDTLLKVMRKHFPAAKTRTQSHSKTHD